MLTALRPAHFTLQRIHKFTIVCQAGQRVMRGLMTDLIFTLFAISDVDARTDAPGDFARRPAQGAEVHSKMPGAVAIFKIGRNASERVRVLRDWRCVWILTFQVIVKRATHQVSRLELGGSEARPPVGGDS